MREEVVTLPSGKGVTLCYEELHPPPDNKPMSTLSVLQLRKDNKCRDEWEQVFDRQIEGIAAKFAHDVLEAYPDVSLVVVPASESGQFLPFLDAFCKAGQQIVPPKAISKPREVRAGDGVPYKKLRDECRVDEQAFESFAEVTGTCVILDDIFGSGASIAATLDLLETRLAKIARFVAACPLRIDESKTLK